MQSPRMSASTYPETDESFTGPVPEPLASRTDRHDSPGADDTYLLRLCLDLKLDALLLTLGAAASDPTCPPADPGPPSTFPDTPADPDTPDADAFEAATFDQLTGLSGDGPVIRPISVPPWQRWLREDLDMAQGIARELLARGGDLPSPLGYAGTPSAAVAVLDQLEMSHDEMRDLLDGTAALSGAAAGTPEPVAGQVAEGQVRAVIRHCRRRLTELGRVRLEMAEPRPAEAATVPEGLPGEFLG